MNWIVYIFFSLSALYALPKPYCDVKVIPEWDFGWYVNREYVDAIFKENDIRTVVEVGSWAGGGSTKHFATLLKEKGGVLHAVDTWLGSSTQQPGEVHHQHTLPYIYEQFLSNMIHWQLTDVVVPHRMCSVEAARVLNVQPDLIYIDGEHTYEAVYEDLTAWYPFVKGRGILCGDDWYWPGVQKAVLQFAEENHLFVEALINFWRVRETPL